jgi:fatty-acyl-CoA synthase
VAIIGVPDEKWGEAGLAFVVVARGETITEGEVREYLKDKVAKFKHPKTIEFVKDLPLTATMKVKKAELKKMYVDRR